MGLWSMISKLFKYSVRKLTFEIPYGASQQTSDIHPMLTQCWASVVECGPTLNQHETNTILGQNIGLTLAQLLRHRPNVNPALNHNLFCSASGRVLCVLNRAEFPSICRNIPRVIKPYRVDRLVNSSSVKFYHANGK